MIINNNLVLAYNNILVITTKLSNTKYIKDLYNRIQSKYREYRFLTTYADAFILANYIYLIYSYSY